MERIREIASGSPHLVTVSYNNHCSYDDGDDDNEKVTLQTILTFTTFAVL